VLKHCYKNQYTSFDILLSLSPVYRRVE